MSIKSFAHVFKRKANRIEKRFRFALSTVILLLVMLVSTFFFFDKAFIFIPLLIILSIGLTYFSLLESIEKIGWFSLFFMPTIVSIAWYGFYFLFPGRWLTRIPFVALYGISIYAMLLTSNIFNIGVEKNLQLYRAAFSVNFFYQALSIFFIFNVLFSFQQYFFVNALVVGIMGYLFAIQLFWTIRLKKFLERETILYGFLVAFILLQIATALSFYPLKPAIYALFLTASYYSLSGLLYHYIDQRLFKETLREYIAVWVFVFFITILSMG